MFSHSNCEDVALCHHPSDGTIASSAVVAPNESAQSSVGSIHTYLMPDLSLKSAFAVPVSALPSGAGFRKTCRCSCGSGSLRN